MQLFLFLNNLAGRWPLLDGVARFFYVGALPALGTLLLAQLLLLPRSGRGVSRSKTALTIVLALALGALLAWGFDLIAGWLHLGNLSPRPWMTRRVNWLVVEPQDNSFPCVELVLAAVLACASWKLNSRWGVVSWAMVALLALTRLFCGNNYFADVLVGSALGASSFALCSQLCQRRLAFAQRAREFSLSASPLAVTLVGCYFFALLSPRFEGKLGIGHPAAAAPSPAAVASLSTASSVNQGEGEGMIPEEGRAEELALAKRSALFLPEVEAYLRGKLTSVARPFALLDVEAAPVKAGTTSYRCAAIRFEVPAEQPNMRRLVVARAARLVQTAFALDSHLQNVDIIAVSRDEGRNLDGSLLTFAGDEVPVFTASIQRQKLIVASPAWANAPGVDPGSWLRARSRIYINTRALPDSAPHEPHLLPNGAVTAKPTPRPSATPLPPKTQAPQRPSAATPRPSTSPSPRPLPNSGVAPQAQPARTPSPKTTSTLRPSATPGAQPPASQSLTPRLKATALSKATSQPNQTASPSLASQTPRPRPTAVNAGSARP